MALPPSVFTTQTPILRVSDSKSRRSLPTQTPRKVSHVSSSFQTLFIKLDLPKASVNQPLSLLSFTPAIPYVAENPPTLPATIYVDEA
ncbi:hypothetical protein BELL_0553g00080 [Botrytis elliptica]|uniref:Uncharacterized protein n=1 Tax=Botrytis elliptica TaxID=278938 RepID=A0A4Z1JQP6_9HELO|nr:hypothetical protein BELL_0553g00080 [Botrytis elliptica]